MFICEAIKNFERKYGKRIGEYEEKYGTIKIVFNDDCLKNETEFVPKNSTELMELWYEFAKESNYSLCGIDYIYEDAEDPYESKWIKDNYWRCLG